MCIRILKYMSCSCSRISHTIQEHHQHKFLLGRSRHSHDCYTRKVQVCINNRATLAKCLNFRTIPYHKSHNCSYISHSIQYYSWRFLLLGNYQHIRIYHLIPKAKIHYCNKSMNCYHIPDSFQSNCNKLSPTCPSIIPLGSLFYRTSLMSCLRWNLIYRIGILIDQ